MQLRATKLSEEPSVWSSDLHRAVTGVGRPPRPQPVKDYYDSAQYLDREPWPVFERRHARVVIDPGDYRTIAPIQPLWDAVSHDVRLRPCFDLGLYILAFCGKGYRFVTWRGYHVQSIPQLCDILTQYGKGDRPARDLSLARDLMAQLDDKRSQTTHVLTQALGTPVFDLPVSLFRHLGVAYASLAEDERGRRLLTLHPILGGPLGFPVDLSLVWDPGWVWQEIDLFLSNSMVEQVDPRIDRTDDLIRDAHGFDTKSFRQTAPGAKKARRANKHHAGGQP